LQKRWGAFAGLIMDQSGNLLGTTVAGGRYNRGVLFRLTRADAWKEKRLHRFGAIVNDGSAPYGTLHMDARGHLYGTTYNGGAEGCGSIFERGSAYRVLYSFCTQGAGKWPLSGLAGVTAKRLYGVTYSSGTPDDAGTLFELARP